MTGYTRNRVAWIPRGRGCQGACDVMAKALLSCPVVREGVSGGKILEKHDEGKRVGRTW